jgi:hypothetical protein
MKLVKTQNSQTRGLNASDVSAKSRAALNAEARTSIDSDIAQQMRQAHDIMRKDRDMLAALAK